MASKISKENRQEIIINELVKTPNISEVAKKTGIGRKTIYNYMGEPAFIAALEEARSVARDNATAYLQGHLEDCAAVLYNIATDEEAGAQTRINACNSIFNNYKLLTSGNEYKLQGVVVNVNDTI